jgi:hypothetical protein
MKDKFPDWVRLLLAGVFVYAGVLGAVVLVSVVWPNPPFWLIVPVGPIVLFIAVILALIVFNAPGAWRRKRYDPVLHANELEAQGLLAVESYKATRCFQVEEFEDEGSHYFLEIEDRRVLFLSGQYLWSYEPVVKKSEIVELRKFPNTEFVLRRHRAARYVVDILCNGVAMEPELVVPSFSADDFGTDRIPEDGQIFADKTFDQLKGYWSKSR